VDSVLLAFRGSWNGDFAPTPEDPLPSIPVPWPSYRPSCPHGNQVVVAHETINEAMSQGTFLRLTCVCGRIPPAPASRRYPADLPRDYSLQVRQVRTL
jgi:hypothetical protein